MNSKRFLLFQLGTEGILATIILFLAGAESVNFNLEIIALGFTGSSETLPTESLIGILFLMMILFSIIVFSSLADHFMSNGSS